MTDVLHLPARAGAPIACDMSTATDTHAERLAEYYELFQRALRGSVELRFDADAREQVESLARREAACCPFLDYRVETTGDEVLFTISNPRSSPHRATSRRLP
jgi:hypothetical protein